MLRIDSVGSPTRRGHMYHHQRNSRRTNADLMFGVCLRQYGDICLASPRLVLSTTSLNDKTKPTRSRLVVVRCDVEEDCSERDDAKHHPNCAGALM